MAKDYRLEKRKFVIGGIALSIVLIYLVRLFALQITTDDYKKNADSNAFLNKIQYPSRGAIYDRTGKLLVFNQPAYDISIVPKEVEDLDTLDLCQSLNITRAQFLKIMSDMKDRRRNPGYSRYTNQVFMSQLSAEECGVFQESYLSFVAFISNVVRSANILTMRLPMRWATSERYLPKRWKRMKTDTTFVEIMSGS